MLEDLGLLTILKSLSPDRYLIAPDLHLDVSKFSNSKTELIISNPHLSPKWTPTQRMIPPSHQQPRPETEASPLISPYSALRSCEIFFLNVSGFTFFPPLLPVQATITWDARNTICSYNQLSSHFLPCNQSHLSKTQSKQVTFLLKTL